MALSGLTSVLMSLLLGVSSFFSGLGTFAYFVINDVTLIEPLDESVYISENSEVSEESDVPTIPNETPSETSVEYLDAVEVFNKTSYGMLEQIKGDASIKDLASLLRVYGLTEELAKEAMTCPLEYTSTNELYDRAALLYSKSSGLMEGNGLKGRAEDDILFRDMRDDNNLFRRSLEYHFSDLHYKVLNYNHPGHLSAHMDKYGDWVGSLIYLGADDYYYGLVYEDYAELALFLDAEYWGEIVQQKIGY